MDCVLYFFHEIIYRLAKLEELIKISFCVSGFPKSRMGLYFCFVHTALCYLLHTFTLIIDTYHLICYLLFSFCVQWEWDYIVGVRNYNKNEGNNLYRGEMHYCFLSVREEKIFISKEDTFVVKL